MPHACFPDRIPMRIERRVTSAQRHSPRKVTMWDLVFIAGTFGLFAVAGLYARFCDRL
jgi:hypothetical protein